MKNTIIISLLVIVVIIGAILLTSNQGTDDSTSLIPATVASAITLDKTVHDFGSIDIFGGKVSTDFILTNSGPDDVTILAGTTSCGCTEGEINGIRFGMHEVMAQQLTIPASQSIPVTAIYNPLAHGPDATGQIKRQLFLKTNSSVNPEIEMRIEANVFKNNS